MAVVRLVPQGILKLFVIPSQAGPPLLDDHPRLQVYTNISTLNAFVDTGKMPIFEVAHLPFIARWIDGRTHKEKLRTVVL